MVTYGELQPGDKFNPNSRPFYFQRTVAKVVPTRAGVVAVHCTDGYAAEVFAGDAAKPQPERG